MGRGTILKKVYQLQRVKIIKMKYQTGLPRLNFRQLRISMKQAEWIGSALMLALILMAYFHSSPHLYIESGCIAFLTLSGALLLLSFIWELLVHILGSQIQEGSKIRPNYKAEIYATLKCVYVVAWIVAWPLAKSRAGEPIGLKWNLADLEENKPSLVIKTIVSVLFADLFSYWKHRLLHLP